ncbi:MAG: cell division protein ZapA [Elusimicrobiota bacterium]
MTSNEPQVKIKGRVLNISIDSLTPLEIATISSQVEEKINDIEGKSQEADTSKLALMAAFEFAIELYTIKQTSMNVTEANSRKIDEMADKLERALHKKH